MGNSPRPVNEQSLPQADLALRRRQAGGRGLLLSLRKSYGIRTVALRFANLYGPFSGHKKGVITVFFRALHEGRPMDRTATARRARDFMYVDDICDALDRSLTADVPGGTTLHVATAVETSIDELAALCAEVAGRPGHPVEHAATRTGEVERNVASYRLAEQVLGYRPAVPLREGLASTWDWYREHVFR